MTEEEKIDCTVCGEFVEEDETIVCQRCGLAVCFDCQMDDRCSDCEEQ